MSLELTAEEQDRLAEAHRATAEMWETIANSDPSQTVRMRAKLQATSSRELERLYTR